MADPSKLARTLAGLPPPHEAPFLPADVGGYNARNAMPYGDLATQTLATRRPPMGMEQQGNINLLNRPSVWNPEGGYSSVYSMSFEDDNGRATLLPLVTDAGAIETPEQAVARYRQSGRHLGQFSTGPMADDYAERLHLQQEQMSKPRGK